MKRTVLLIMLLMISSQVLGQPIDPRVHDLKVDMATIVSDLSLLSEGPITGTKQPRKIVGLAQAWDRLPDGISISSSYYVADTAAEAGEILTNILLNQQEPILNTDFGDVAFGESGRLLFAQGTAIFDLSVIVPPELENAYPTTDLVETIANAVKSKMEANGHLRAPPLDVELVTVSNRVTDAEVAEFRLISHTPADFIPVQHFISIGGSNSRVLRIKVEDTGNGASFTWNGFDETGQSLPDGEYQVSVSSSDVLLRNENNSTTIEISRGSGGGPSNTVLSATRDATIRFRDPHINEGANPALILKKVQGKTTRGLAGFAVDGVDLAGLLSATLVLNIDPGFSPTGWGNGRNVSALPIIASWTEGNGKDLEVPNSQQTNGSGAGATWFSPVDEDISNSSPNSSITWDGASTSTGPQTAPSVTISNHQTGEVQFDVTQDVLNGTTSWVITRDEENVGSKVHFLSKEGGGASLGPRLILDYGGGSAAVGDKNKALAAVHAARLKKNVPDFESSIQYVLNPDLMMVASQELLVFAFRGHPFAEVFTRLFFSGWQAGLV